MTLKEKLCEPFSGLRVETADQLEKIVDDFAIGFAEWRLTTFIKNVDEYTMKELLEIYKKEKGL